MADRLPPPPAAALALLLLAGCGAAPDPASAGPPGIDRAAWEKADRAARRAFALGAWEEAAARYERKIALVPAPAAGAPDAPLLDAALRVDLYNLACSRALAGRGAAALDALEQAMSGEATPVGFDHLVEDPDLASLHREPRWEALRRRLSWNESLSTYHPSLAAGFPVVVELLAEVPAPGAPRGLPGAVVVRPAPPYRAGKDRLAWTSRLDPGERAAEKVDLALRLCAPSGGPEPRVLRASGPDMVRLAWEVLLRRPDAFSHAVLDGPAPPARLLLDRGAERLKTAILVSSAAGLPDPAVGARVEDAGSVDEALRRALR